MKPNNKRIEYIDYLKGLSVTWVVWFHTTHPEFVDYPYRIPLFFFVSGIFFKPYSWSIFWRKKINQLIIPFVLFYIIYYIYMIGINLLKYKSFSHFNPCSILELFQTYTGNDTFIINPPLWFICALINLQILLYILTKCTSKKWIIFAISIIVSTTGIYYIKQVPTPFMIGRSLPFFLYYVTGYIGGKVLIKYLNSNKNYIISIITCFIIGGVIHIIKESTLTNIYIIDFLNYVEILSVIVMLLIIFSKTYQYPLLYPLKFFGVNSYIVLGMHEIYQTTFRIALENTFGSISISLGIIQTIMTLLLLWPTILLFNKYIPSLVAKKDFFKIREQN